MKIKERIAMQFTWIVASILVAFSMLIYTVSANFREEEFNDRLYSRASTTCRFLVKVNEVDVDLLRIIDENTHGLIDENILVFNGEGKVIYSVGDSARLRYDAAFLEKVKEEGSVEWYHEDRQGVGMVYTEGDEPLVVLASAEDKFGNNKLRNLKQTLIWSLSVGILLTVILSFHFSGASLRPISDINRQISSITASNLKQRLPFPNSHDEIGQLASNFNDVLAKLESAFEKQRSFVSHASHELRTPLAGLKSEIQLAEKRMGDSPEAREVFSNLSGDTERLIRITNSLLLFARSLEDMGQIQMERVRVEDILFAAKSELQFVQGVGPILIDYVDLPEDENATLVVGDEELLKRVCVNLMDNASKYSNGQPVRVLIKADSTHCYVSFEDSGIGIPREDFQNVFEVFYRAPNAVAHSGFGIGLSICHRIVEMHGGEILVASELNKGSSFTVKLRHV